MFPWQDTLRALWDQEHKSVVGRDAQGLQRKEVFPQTAKIKTMLNITKSKSQASRGGCLFW